MLGPIRANTNLRWIGFYLSHSAQGGSTTWIKNRARVPQVSTWRYLRSEGWGAAPIFLARQFLAGGGANPNWTRANGVIDGQLTVRLATESNAINAAEIERGATIYLDLEADGFLSTASAVEYVTGWADTVRASGFRPGVYCLHPGGNPHPAWQSDGKLVRALFPDMPVWMVRIPTPQPKVFDEATGWLTLPAASNFQDADGSVGRFGYLASQFAWYNDSRPPHVSARLKTGPGSFHVVAPIDFDAAMVPDPSHPEDRAALALSAFGPGQPAAFAVTVDGAAWQCNDGHWGDWSQLVARSADCPFAERGYGKWFDTRAAAAASRRPGLVDLFLIGIDGTVATAWRTEDRPGVEGTWSVQAITPPQGARHGSAIAAVSRRLDLLDVFFFNPSHEMATTWWMPADGNWHAHVGAITHGFAFAPGASIDALTSAADSERVDVFAVDAANVVRWVQWRNGAAWQCIPVPMAGLADPVVGAHAAWLGAQLHLLVGLRDGSVVHLMNVDGNLATAWILLGFLPQIPATRPMGLVLKVLAESLVAVAVASNQALAWSAFEGGLWTLPGVDLALPPYSASGRITAMAADAASLDVMLPNQLGNIVIRRLARGAPMAPLTLSGAWEMTL